jgi:hypothetical protein
MSLKALGLAGLAASIIAAPALAHHSTAMFDQTKVTYLSGTVKQFEWINPHVWLHLTITNASGQEATWSFEGGSPAQLTQLGWKPESFNVGAKVAIGFRPMKDGSRGGQIMNVTPGNGQKVCSNRGCG